MRKPIVWVVKEQARRTQTGTELMDYTPAMQYGEVRFITQFDPPTMVTKSGALGFWGKQVREFLNTFDPTIDFIIASGQPTAMMMIGYMLGEVNGKVGTATGYFEPKPRFLLWRREEGKYMPYDALNQG